MLKMFKLNCSKEQQWKDKGTFFQRSVVCPSHHKLGSFRAWHQGTQQTEECWVHCASPSSQPSELDTGDAWTPHPQQQTRLLLEKHIWMTSNTSISPPYANFTTKSCIDDSLLRVMFSRGFAYYKMWNLYCVIPRLRDSKQQTSEENV